MAGTTTDYFRYWLDEWVPIDATWAGASRSADTFVIRQLLTPLKTGTTYQLNFKVKGRTIQNGVATVAYLGANEGKPTKFEKGERGVPKPSRTRSNEESEETVTFSSSATGRRSRRPSPSDFRQKGIRSLRPRRWPSWSSSFSSRNISGIARSATCKSRPSRNKAVSAPRMR